MEINTDVYVIGSISKFLSRDVVADFSLEPLHNNSCFLMNYRIY